MEKSLCRRNMLLDKANMLRNELSFLNHCRIPGEYGLSIKAEKNSILGT